MGKVFISYRRNDSSGHAGRLYDRLAEHLDDNAVFMDVDSIPAGENFKSYMDRSLADCDVCIVVIGQNWNIDRLYEENDYVRNEILTALSRHILVIPALFDGAKVPEASQLPTELKDLSYCQAYDFHTGRDFRQQVRQLLADVDRAMAEAKRWRLQEDRKALQSIALRPHQYPLWVLSIWGLIILSALASVVWVPKHVRALGNLWRAQEVYTAGDRAAAISLFRTALNDVSSSKKAKIGLAIALFSSESPAADGEALTILSDITIDSSEWSQLTKVMPDKYQELFRKVKKP